jgi:hypothetical protein
MNEKKPQSYTSPNLQGLQEVKIDHRTKIYIPIGDDPDKAREHFLNKILERKYK